MSATAQRPIAAAPASETAAASDERGGGDARAERAAVQLVEAVRGDADREQERHERPGQPRAA